MNEDKFLEVAKKAVLEAEKVISNSSGGAHNISIKNNDLSDIATEADLEAEEVIVRILTENFPSHSIIAEEKEKKYKESEYTWVIDPLDGSFAFLKNVPFFGVSIGLLKDGKPILGVINHISFKNLYWAQEGMGAFLNGEKIHVSSEEKLDMAAVVLDLSHIATRKSKIDLYVKPLITKVGYYYSLGGTTVTLGLLAQGILDADVSQTWLWDFAAGVVIVREAGGKVTDFEGNEPDWTKERLTVIASNGLIHDQILEALKE